MLTMLLAICVTACAALGSARAAVSFERLDNAIIVPVTVEGRGPFRFMLDTGAGRSAVSSRVVEQAGLKADSTTVVLTPSGRSLRPMTNTSLGIGGRSPVRVDAIIVDHDGLVRGGAAIDGIIGQDVLAPLVYTIDFARREVVWEGAFEDTNGRRLPLEFEHGSAFVTLGGDAHAPLRLIPDTGTDSIVLFARPGRELPVLTPLDVGLLRTISGQQLARRVVVHELNVGEITLREQLAVVVNARSHDAALGDGLLPLHLFSRVTINGPRGYVVVSGSSKTNRRATRPGPFQF